MTLSRFFFIIAAIFSVIIGLVSYRFLVLDMNLAFRDFADHINNRNLTLLAHISAAPADTNRKILAIERFFF